MKRLNSEKISSEEVSILDNNAEWLGVSKSHLMECAGYAFAIEIVNRFDLTENSRVAIFCGTGNNGGDGFVVARQLSSFDIKTLVVLIGAPENIRTDEAKLNWNVVSKSLIYSVKIEIVRDSKNVGKIGAIFDEGVGFDLMVDGLLGTGIRGRIKEPISSAIDLINSLKEQKRLPVVSIDIPSGLDPNTGEIEDKAVKADLVITFHRNKKGMEPNTDYIKDIIVKSIGIPKEATLIIGRGDVIPTLKVRKIDTHKGLFGRILVIGGSKNYSGAPAYSSLTCINFGIDLVITFVPEAVGNVIRSYSPNLIVRTQPGEWLHLDAFDEIAFLIDWANAIVIGPGMGIEKQTEKLLVKILEKLKESKKSFVLDADALKLVRDHLDLIKNQSVIVTPHAGELKIMTGVDLPLYNQVDERIKVVSDLAKKLGVTLLIKGPYDYISNGTLTKINITHCPEMSIGGTGDVLAGLCTCLLATENDPFRSACSATFLNGYLGEYCKKELGSRFNAVDMIANINKGFLQLQGSQL